MMVDDQIAVEHHYILNISAAQISHNQVGHGYTQRVKVKGLTTG
jgi:hypothetical protein